MRKGEEMRDKGGGGRGRVESGVREARRMAREQ